MINFEHSSITDVNYAPPGVTFLSLKSSNLFGRGGVSVYVPPSAVGKKNVPYVILLHGVYGSHFSWLYQAGVHLVLEQMIFEKKIDPFILVMPSDGLTGDGSGYLPHLEKNHEKWIVEDVISAIHYHFEEIAEQSLAFISGLSMGGYGALRLGMKYHEIFKGISAHSSITDLDDLQTFIDEDSRGPLSDDTIRQSAILTNAIKYQATLPPLRFDCGADDRLIESNRKLHQQLSDAGIEHIHEEFEGIHNYEYWTKHIADSFAYFQQFL
ncbi:MAG: prolyl oligopeptidase family serine peptidase [Saprospiraceae bacterium]|nr:prolyl oligopeptidase family serine peptidase [Saprospiraceae bacterium]